MGLGARQSQRLTALFALGCLLFGWPMLALFNLEVRVLGLPLLYVWLFGAWAALIAAMALVATSRSG